MKVAYETISAICNQQNKFQSSSIANVFLVWMESVYSAEIESLLLTSEIATATFWEVLNSAGKEESLLDEKIIMHSIRNSDNNQPTPAIHVLLRVLNEHQHPITRNCLEKKIEIGRLINAISWEMSKIESRQKNRETISLQYATNLNSTVMKDEYNSLFFREDLLHKLITILQSQTCRSPLLIGPSGSGKSSLVKSLVRKIIKKNAGELNQCVVFSLCVNDLIASTKFRGEFEEKIKKVLDEISRNDNIILFLDEFHMLISAGKAEGSVATGDNILKHYMDARKLRIIGATTSSEFDRYVKQDEALVRRFQRVDVPAPNKDTCLKIIRQHLPQITGNYHSAVSEEIINKAYDLSETYLINQFKSQPDTTIRLLDITFTQACTKTKAIIEEQDLKNTIQEYFQIPARFMFPESLSYGKLQNRVEEKLFGQSDELGKLLPAVLKSLAFPALKAKGTLGNFLLLGPSGVGKDETCRILADEVFGSEEYLFHIECGKYKNIADITTLLGSPPGYRDSEKTGTLPKFIQRCKEGIILYSEIEKADREILDTLLRMTDEGIFEDAKGDIYNCRNYFIFCTSNAIVQQHVAMVGFNAMENKEAIIREKLQKSFRPEFLNRFTHISLYQYLSKAAVCQILQRKLDRLKAYLHNEKHIFLQEDEHFIERFYAPDIRDGRAANRYFETFIEEAVASFIMEENQRMLKKVFIKNGSTKKIEVFS
jgi:ATP-dependent Clp protease ATP-binding subunit ClpA